MKMSQVRSSGDVGVPVLQKERRFGEVPGPSPPLEKPRSGPVTGNFEEEDWKSVSGDDEGHVEGHVDGVILETSTSVDSTGSIFLFLERNEDNSSWLNYVGIKPGSYLQQNEVRRHYNKTQTERNLCSRSGQKWFCRGPMVPGQSESTDMGKESRNHVFPQDKTCLSQQVDTTSGCYHVSYSF